MDWSMWSSLGAISAAGVAAWQLYLNRVNSRKESFQSTFNVLLEQHSNTHANIRNYIKNIWEHYKEEEKKHIKSHSYSPKKLNSVDDSLYRLLCEYFKFGLNARRRYKIEGSVYDLVNIVRDNSVLSPYFRQVYHIIKLIDEDAYFKKCDVKTERKGFFSIIPGFFQDYCNEKNKKSNNQVILEKKKYTNILRSYIDDDILLLVAINALKVTDNRSDLHNSDYRKYRDLLIKFDFLQHLRLLAWYKDNDTKVNECRDIIKDIEYVKNFCQSTVIKRDGLDNFDMSTYQGIYLYEFANYIYGRSGKFNKDLIVGHFLSKVDGFHDYLSVDIDEARNTISTLIDDINKKNL